MGLDMYLKRKIYYGLNYKHNNIEGKKTKIVINDEVVDHTDLEEISFQVGYWRKFNALHNYFVENIQEGVDDCKEYWISEEKLKDIINLCQKDIEYLDTLKLENDIYINVDDEKLNLIPKSGFFFGSTEINTWHYEMLKNTINQLTEALSINGDFYYQSSW